MDDELFGHLQEQKEAINEEHNSIILKLDGSLSEKEKLLAAIKSSQNQMQNDLLSLMKNQYHQKIIQLTNDITQLEQAKAENLSKKGSQITQQQRRKIEDQFMNKQKDLERQLKDYKEKNKQQQLVKKQVDHQNQKIKTLESEIQKIKVQKIGAQRKWKEETDKYNKLRKDKANEILKLKKDKLKRDQEIDKLKKEAKRKDLLNKRKQEEIKVLQIQKNLNHSKKANATKLRREKLDIDTQRIKEWIRGSVDKMIELADAEQEIRTQQKQLDEVEVDIELELNHKASLQLLKDKLLVKKYMIEGRPDDEQDQEQLFNLEQEQEKIELEIEQYQENVNSLSAKQDYINTKISEVSREIVEVNISFNGSLAKYNLQTPEGIKTLIDSFFQILQEASIQLRQLQLQHEKEICAHEQLKEEYQNQQNILEANEKYFQAKIQNIEIEYQHKELLLNQLIEEARMEQDEKDEGKNIGTIQNSMSNLALGQTVSAVNGKIIQQRMLTAKQELQKSKEAAMNESKMFLSKRVAELEKCNKESEKHNKNLQNKLNIALSDKEQLKQQVNQLKNQLKLTNEMTSDINLRNAIQNQYGIGQGNQAVNINTSAANNFNQHGAAAGNQPNRRVFSLAERRAEMKSIKNNAKRERNESTNKNAPQCGGFTTPRGILVHNADRFPNLPHRETVQSPNDADKNDQHSDGSPLVDGQLSDDEPIQSVSITGNGGPDPNDFHRQSEIGVSNSQLRKQGQGKENQNNKKSDVLLSSRERGSSSKKREAFAFNLRRTGSSQNVRLSQPLHKHSASEANINGIEPRGSGSNVKSRVRRTVENVFDRLTSTSVLGKKSSEGFADRKRKNPRNMPGFQSALGFRTGKQQNRKTGGPQTLSTNAGKRNETRYSNRSHYNKNEPNDSDTEQPIDDNYLRSNAPNECPDFNTANISDNQFVKQVPLRQNSRDYPPITIQNQDQAHWNVERVIDNAHKSQIYNLATVGNLLYSTSYMSLKIWDLNTMELISDIQAHKGIIKCVQTMHTNTQGETIGNQIFATAGDKNDKQIHIWDMTTLTNMTTLKGHKGEIRALEFSKDGKYLFSGGQGGLFVWDLRNTDVPVELIEKQMDVFSLKATRDNLLMGCRNHSLIPVGLSPHALFQEQVQQPLQPPHLDVVTSVATLHSEQIIVSSSKDGSLKGWTASSPFNQGVNLNEYSGSFTQKDIRHLNNITVTGAHSDHINVLESSYNQTEMYSGSKDGTVKIWNLVEKPRDLALVSDQNFAIDEQVEYMTLQEVASLNGQGSGVTSIASLDQSFGNVIVYASQDKSLRICKGYDEVAQDHFNQQHQQIDEIQASNTFGNQNRTFEYIERADEQMIDQQDFQFEEDPAMNQNKKAGLKLNLDFLNNQQ